MTLLLESALRSLLLGVLACALLRLARVRDTGTETFIWTFILLVALAMPLLSRYLPPLLVAVPRLAAAAPAPAGAHGSVAAPGAPALLWFARRGSLVLPALYLVGVLLHLGRLATGVCLTLRLYRGATPVQSIWARGRRIRTSAALKSPVTLAHTIVLPANFSQWSATKLEAVLAHEEAHRARGDFFVQLAASVHCALFWFSPFAWWLQSKLAEIAESASDEAAIRRLNDPLLYAEILVDVARGAGAVSLSVGMAKGPLIQQRIDRILYATANPRLTPPVRVLVVTTLLGVSVMVATARPAVGEEPVSDAALHPVPIGAASTAATPSPGRKTAATHHRQHLRALTPPASPDTDSLPGREAVSYNPRALLEPVYIAPRAYAPASTIVHASKTFYIRSTERPVADALFADGK